MNEAMAAAPFLWWRKKGTTKYGKTNEMMMIFNPKKREV
jgi:hypothetical protein